MRPREQKIHSFMSLSAQEKWYLALSARGGSTFGGLVSIL